MQAELTHLECRGGSFSPEREGIDGSTRRDAVGQQIVMLDENNEAEVSCDYCGAVLKVERFAGEKLAAAWQKRRAASWRWLAGGGCASLAPSTLLWMSVPMNSLWTAGAFVVGMALAALCACAVMIGLAMRGGGRMEYEVNRMSEPILPSRPGHYAVHEVKDV